MDESGTINPAALNASSTPTTISPILLTQQSSRGLKRARSDDIDEALYPPLNPYDDLKSSKRSRPHDHSSSDQTSQMLAPVQTPQTKSESLPYTSPTHTSPQRTPGSASKTPVVKALPTVRDHTTDQLNDARDEYIYREVDSEGEKKASKDGPLLDGREYRVKTFQVPKRGEKLFMLATECARVLAYRDSYLLFNKNRSLYKIIANQEEKDDLIRQEILPYSYRSRQIAIVTARSMFRQFGSRLVKDGKRVRDDYWEAKARKQGFTEADAAGEKRPGAAKAREAAQAAGAIHTTAIPAMPQAEIIYNTNGLDGGQPPLLGHQNLAPLPMIHLPSDETRPGAYNAMARPRQDISGAPYQDRSQPSAAADIMAQAVPAAEYNKQLAYTRQHRTNYLNDYWQRPHEQPAQPSTQPEAAVASLAAQNLASPQAMPGANQRMQDQMAHAGNPMMSAMYPGYTNQQNPMASPVGGMHRSLPPSQLHQSSPGMPGRQNPAYASYQQSQMWQQQQVAQQQSQQSSMQAGHMSAYAQQPQHAQMAPPQMTAQPGLNYTQMNAMNPAFAGMNRNMYQQGQVQQQQQQQQQQQYNLPQQGAGQQPGAMQGWQNNLSQYGQGGF